MIAKAKNFQWIDKFKRSWKGYCNHCGRETRWGAVRWPSTTVPEIGCEHCGRS